MEKSKKFKKNRQPPPGADKDPRRNELPLEDPYDEPEIDEEYLEDTNSNDDEWE